MKITLCYQACSLPYLKGAIKQLT